MIRARGARRCWRCGRSRPSRGCGSTRSPFPRPAPDEVLVEVETASVCGTDLHIYGWDEWSQGRIQPPLTLGHEFAGTVVETGALVRTRRGRRLRLGREPHHLRHVLPVPHRPRAHVRADAHPRRRPRRRVRALRRRAGVGDLAERPLEAAARDRDAPGAVRERRLRDQRAGPRRPLGRRARLRADRALHDRDRARVGRRGRRGRRPDAVPARSRREDGRERDASTSTRRPTRRLVPRARTRARLRRRLRDVGLAARDRRCVPDRAQRRPCDPVRDPVAAGRDRRRRVADLQEPERARAERAQDLRDLVPDALAARERASSTCGR